MSTNLHNRLISGFLGTMFAVVSAFSTLPQIASEAAEEDNYLYTDDGFAYIVNEDDTVSIMGRDSEREYDKTELIFPSTIDGKLVTRIGTRAFGGDLVGNNTAYEKVVLPDHIEYIEGWAFNGFKNLKELTIPATLKEASRPFTYSKIDKVIFEDGMEKIPDGMFSSTDQILEVVIPDSVSEIGNEAFNSCGKLKEVHIPDSVKRIGPGAFSNDVDLEVLDLPDELDYIGSYAFSGLKSLKSVTVPDTWTFDPEGRDSFSKSGLTEITFGPERTVIPQGMCNQCSDLETINWPDAPVTIERDAFVSCEKITDPKIPDSVKNIGYQAFCKCSGIEKLDLPASLESLERFAFSECTSLKELYVPMQLPSLGEYAVASAFAYSGIEKLTIGEGITELSALYSSLPELTEISLPSTLEYISDHAFEGDKKLAEINIPEGVKKISGYGVFTGCDSLEELEIPSTLEESDWIISSAPELKKVVFRDGIETIPKGCLRGCPKLTTIVIPDSVTVIEDYAFNALPITSIKLPSGLTTIGNDAFSKSKLESLFIPKTVTGAQQIARETEDLLTVEFEDGIKSIPAKALYECPSVEKIILPSSVENIEKEAFAYCKELVEIECPLEDISFDATAFDYSDKLWDNRVSFVERGGLYLTENAYSVTEGALINYAIHYSINPRFRDVFKKGDIVFSSTCSDLIVEESLSHPSTKEYYGNRHFEVTEPEGTIRLSIRSNGKKQLSTKAWMKVQIHPDEEKEWDGRNISSSELDIAPITLEVPDTAGIYDGECHFYASGCAPLGSDVTVRINGKDSVTVKASKYTGRYSAYVTLESEECDISVDAVCGETTSQKFSVTLVENPPEIKSVVYTSAKQADLTDDFVKGKKSYMTINPRYGNKFEVELSDNSNIAKLLMTSEVDGEYSSIPLDFNENTGKWEGSGYFDTTVPGKLSITQIPEQQKAMLVKTVKDNVPSLKYKGSDTDYYNLNQTVGDFVDPVDALLSNVTVSTKVATKDTTMIRLDYLPPQEFLDENPGIDEFGITIYQNITESIDFGDGKISVDSVIESPEDYGFTESAVQMTDENGEIHSYYAMPLTDTLMAEAIAKSMSITADISPDFSDAYSFLRSKPYDSLIGMVIADVNKTTGIAQFETQIVTEQQVNNPFMKEHGEHIGSQITNVDLAIITDALSKTGQNWVGAANIVFTTVGACYDIYSFNASCNDQLEQIDFSKDPYVKAHKEQLKAESRSIFYGRVTTTVVAATLSVGLTIVGAVAGVALLPGIIAGGLIGLGAYMIHKWFDRREDALQRELYGDKRYRIGKKADPNAILDPSGIVYEVLEDNPVEGATAEIWYKDGNDSAVRWDAEEYDQINPQITGEDGWFAWDVPEGLWQVRVSKEGYEDAASDWLPVLPVQLGILIPMISKATSKLADVVPYSNRVELKFSAFIRDDSLADDTVYLTDKDGNPVPCRIKAVKADNNKTAFTDTVYLISEGADFTGSSLVLTDKVLTYNGKPVEPITMKLDITSEGPPIVIEDDVVMGDVNDDGMVDSNDATCILVEYSATSTGSERTFTEKMLRAGDVNYDGFVDSGDASSVLEYYAYVQTDGDLTSNEYFKAA